MKFTYIFENPFFIIYVLTRVLIRLFVGCNIRNDIFSRRGWHRIDGFLKSFNVPIYLIRSSLINQVHRNVSERPFQHEPKVSNYLRRKTGDVCIDISANFGYYSFLLYNNFKRIIAIEPHPLNIDILQGVKQKFDYDRVEILNIAISDTEGYLPLYTGAHSGRHSLLKTGRLIGEKEFTIVRAKTLTSIIGDTLIDLVKVDVEGVEWMVLKGAQSRLNQIKSWLIELHDLTRKNELKQWFETRNYTCNWVDEHHVYAVRKQLAHYYPNTLVNK